MLQPRQPFLHELVPVLTAPTQAWSGHHGQINTTDNVAQGVLHGDIRVLSQVDVRVDGLPGEHVATRVEGRTAVFTTLLRHIDDERSDSPDPQVRLDRTRTVQPGEVVERLVLSSQRLTPVQVEVSVGFASDFASMAEIKTGDRVPARPFGSAAEGDQIGWTGSQLSVQLQCPGATLTPTPDDLGLTASWTLLIPPGGRVEAAWQLNVTHLGGGFIAATSPPLSTAQPAVADDRLRRWLDQSVTDLNSLAMAAPEHPNDVFLAAGAPWYLTLFGRDSIWAARMLLPIDLSLACGTLRTLARLQGTTTDIATAEQPGKIMHEQRRAEFQLGDMSLPALYYGTIDATPLWVALLHDAWRAGLADAEVEALLPHLERALAWLVDHGDADGDGFLECIDTSGRGLANQGWKDSRDSIRFADGTIAEGPVALCEVQGYAYEAAIGGAAMLDAFGRPGGERYRRWAADLQERFRRDFWCGVGEDRYPALALDGAKRRVDSLTSNIGHLLGTGLLSADEERVVAARVSSPALDSGLGLRTMASTDAGYSPLSYHCGSVWPHDTAIVIVGLHRAGLGAYAAGLQEGLLRATVAFGPRLPELYSGEGHPVPYPAACRPQAWSAAAAVAVAAVTAEFGVRSGRPA